MIDDVVLRVITEDPTSSHTARKVLLALPYGKVWQDTMWAEYCRRKRIEHIPIPEQERQRVYSLRFEKINYKR